MQLITHKVCVFMIYASISVNLLPLGIPCATFNDYELATPRHGVLSDRGTVGSDCALNFCAHFSLVFSVT